MTNIFQNLSLIGLNQGAYWKKLSFTELDQAITRTDLSFNAVKQGATNENLSFNELTEQKTMNSELNNYSAFATAVFLVAVIDAISLE